MAKYTGTKATLLKCLERRDAKIAELDQQIETLKRRNEVLEAAALEELPPLPASTRYNYESRAKVLDAAAEKLDRLIEWGVNNRCYGNTHDEEIASAIALMLIRTKAVGPNGSPFLNIAMVGLEEANWRTEMKQVREMYRDHMRFMYHLNDAPAPIEYADNGNGSYEALPTVGADVFRKGCVWKIDRMINILQLDDKLHIEFANEDSAEFVDPTDDFWMLDAVAPGCAKPPVFTIVPNAHPTIEGAVSAESVVGVQHRGKGQILGVAMQIKSEELPRTQKGVSD